MNDPRCPLCGSEHLETAGGSHEFVKRRRGPAFWVQITRYKCLECHEVFTVQRPAPAAAQKSA